MTRKPSRHSPEMTRYLARLYDPVNRRFAFRAGTPAEAAEWREKARPALRALVGLDLIRRQARGHRPSVTLGRVDRQPGFTRRLCALETEPGITIPFWLLRPSGAGGPLPLAVMPHGHDRIGHDTYAGVAHDEKHAEKIRSQDRDVAVQAARRGFLAIAPATRGLAEGFIADPDKKFSGWGCASHSMHVLMAGRTSPGERSWDIERLIDWATGSGEADPRRILVMGNSGGGVVAVFAAACDPRIRVAVSSCAFGPFASPAGILQLHHCHAVPGIMNFGEFHDIAALVAPRHLLAVHGRLDPLFPLSETRRVTAATRAAFRASGVPGNFRQRYGDGGHRFYSDLMWPFVEKALSGEIPDRSA